MKRWMAWSALAAALVAAVLIAGCSRDEEPTRVAGILPNGLTVVAQENRSSELVAIHVWVRDGSIYETPAESGLSNLITRALLSESEEFESGSMVRLIESLGGKIGAYSSPDYSRYLAIVPARHFDVTLDAISYCLLHPVFSPELIESRKAAIISEIEAAGDRALDQASSLADDLLYEGRTRAVPYGTVETLSGFTAEQVSERYRERYVPSNMVVSVAGGVSPSHAADRIEEIFGSIDSGTPAEPVLKSVDWPESPRRATAYRDIKTSYMVISFPAPGVNDPEAVTMDIVLAMLSRRRVSLLTRVLKDELGLVQAANAGWLTTAVPSPLTIWLELPPENVEEAEQAVVDIVRQFAAEPPSEDDVAVAIRQMEAYVQFGKETSNGKASHGAYWGTNATPEFDETYLRRLSEVTPEDVRAASERYLRPESRIVATVLPNWARSGRSAPSTERRTERGK